MIFKADELGLIDTPEIIGHEQFALIIRRGADEFVPESDDFTKAVRLRYPQAFAGIGNSFLIK